MDDLNEQALAATARVRNAPGYRSLGAAERSELDHHLGRIEAALQEQPAQPFDGRGQSYSTSDPYAIPLATPGDLRGPGGLRGPRPGQPGRGPGPGPPPTQRPARPRPPPGTEVLGQRARRALDAVDFPSFVAELIRGTFQAVVDATAQQVREYAKLVADLSQSLDNFTRDNVSQNQGRDWLVEKYPRDLTLALPSPGEDTAPQILPRDDAEESPDWLADFGLEGEELTTELAEGPLLNAGRRALGEERMRTLATMVLIGVNRIVIDDGQLRARLQFHARARERVTAEVSAQTGAQQMGITGRQAGMQGVVSTMVSTVDVNAQSDISIKTELVGEVSLRFRTQTFDLENFADTPAITLINRHSLRREGATAIAAPGDAGAGAGPEGAAAGPAPVAPPNDGDQT